MKKYFIVLSTAMWGQQAVSPTINQTPTRQFGQPSLAIPLTQASPNLVEGRELNAPGQVAFDNSVNPPIMYVADIGNNRVLAFQSIAKLGGGNFADLVIGQQDMFSTIAKGPGTSLSTGLNSPSGVAVNGKGDLYVADTGNNRILRFPAPFAQQAGSPPQPDLVIGQKGFNTGRSPNEGGPCASKTVAFAANGQPYVTSLTIDSNGNLWTTDPLNNRVLMYPVANLAAGAVEPVATVVLGQNDFTTNSIPSSGNVGLQLFKGSVVQPSSLAFDTSGNLYVADAYSRVLYFQGPNFVSQGQTASRVLGIPPPVASGQPATVYPTQYTLGFPNANGNLIPPDGVFTLGNNLFVADTPAHRIIEYDTPSKWAAESTAFPSPPALAVFGQNGFNAGQANQGKAQPDQFTLSSPYAGAFVGNQMWVSDTGNNRVLAFAPTSTGYTGASIVVGQLDYIYNAPNLIEGKEVFLSGSALQGSAMVIDKNSNPPHLYVADPGNNRILCFNDARIVGQTAGAKADLVIGQPDLKTAEINWPLGLALRPTQTGLHTPIGVVVDDKGNLYVADEGNGRVLRFPAPFSQPPGAQQTADLVLGQSNFTTLIQNASANSMHSPWGVALFAGSDANATPLAGGLAVSDPSYHRVLIFKKQGADFVNGQSAYLAIGQSSFSAISAGNGAASFNTPLGIASDTSDRLYVSDSQNNRVLIFTQAPENLSNGPTSSLTIPNISQPQGVVVSSITTELWVTNTGGFQILRFPEYNRCQLISCTATAFLSANASPLGLTLDGSDNVIVGDAANRVTFYFAQAFFRHAANYNTQSLVPGMLAILGRLGLPMSIQDAAASSSTWPTTLADLNVSVNGTLAPIFATIGGYGAISFQVPQSAPTSGTATVMVTQASTGAVLGVGTFQTAKANPGFFTSNQNGIGPVIARNLVDNTLNTAANPVARGADFYVCLTGEGPVSGAPPDGQPPSAAASTPILPTLLVQAAPATISYSGVGCGFAGGWQINATIPMVAIPGPNAIVLTYNGFASNIGGTTASDNIAPGQDVRISTSIYVK